MGMNLTEDFSENQNSTVVEGEVVGFSEDQIIPWYRPILKIIEAFDNWDYTILGAGLFCLLLTAFIIICCCRLNHRKKKIENGKRRSRSKKEREKVTSDELVTSNIYETGLEATNPIFGLPPKDDKEIDEAHAGEIVTLIPKGENLAQGASQKKVKVYERPNYPESNASSHKNVPGEKSLNQSDTSRTSRKSHRSTGSQTLPRGVSAATFQLPPINTEQSTFQLRKVGVPIAPVSPVPVIKKPTPPTSPM